MTEPTEVKCKRCLDEAPESDMVSVGKGKWECPGCHERSGLDTLRFYGIQVGKQILAYDKLSWNHPDYLVESFLSHSDLTSGHFEPRPVKIVATSEGVEVVLVTYIERDLND